MDFFYQQDKSAKIPSRQAFSQAREKISYGAFKELFETSCLIAVTDNEARRFKGYRLFAIDGTSFIVGRIEKLKGFFGETTTVPGKAMCRLSCVVDVLGDYIVNAGVSPISTGERALAIEQTEDLKSVSDALFLFDRGYWSPELTASIMSNGQKFLMRLQSSHQNAAAKKNLRVYSFMLPGGNEETLVTNLTKDEMSDDDLAGLYAKRWGIETKYLTLKARLQIDSFSGESENIVLQDIYSTLYISNLTAFICCEADEVLLKRTSGRGSKYQKKTNRSICIAALRTRFVALCIEEDNEIQAAALIRLRDDISSCVIYERKSKSRPRSSGRLKNISRSTAKMFL